MSRARLLAAGDPEWLAALGTMDHDVYHRPDYCSISARVDGGEAIAVLAAKNESQTLIPLIKRPLGDGLWDAVSPYGYGGPVTSTGTDLDLVDELLADAFGHLAAQGCVSLFLRMHPGINAEWPSRLGVDATLTSNTVTVALALEKSEGAVLKEMKSGHRYQVRQALKAGYSVEEDLEDAYRDRFARLYRQNMEHLAASAYYLFDDSYFESLLHGRGGPPARLWVALKGDELAAAAIFTAEGEWVQYHLAASDPSHRRFSPGKLLIHSARMEYQARGHRWLHLGGGVGGENDSLFEFKAGFGGERLTYRTYGLVLDRAAYQNLVGARGSTDQSTAYFPAYRAP